MPVSGHISGPDGDDFDKGFFLSVWILFLIGLNFALVAAVAVLWLKVSRPQKDDPRLSKGLQLLQSKIAVLEDLSDRSENQVNQLVKVLDSKIREVQGYMQRSDQQLDQIDQSMKKSLEVAEIFEDKIPHEEIIERQNTKKYLEAARLANEGKSIGEIAEQVDLTRGEIDFISKLNRDEILDGYNWSSDIGRDLEGAFGAVGKKSESVDKIKQEFEKACEDHEANQQRMEDKYKKFSSIEPNKFREQVQSFVDNMLSKSGGAEKEPDSEGAEPTVETDLHFGTGPVGQASDEAIPVAAEKELFSEDLGPVGLMEGDTPEAKIEAAEEPVTSTQEPEMPVSSMGKLSDRKEAVKELTQELLKKVSSGKPEKSNKFIRAEDSGSEVRKVKFPRIDLS